MTPMIEARLALAIESVLEHEGGHADHPADRGGPTRFGITRRTWEDYPGGRTGFPDAVTRERAIEFYKWWLIGTKWHDVRKIRPLTPMVMLAHMEVLHGRKAGCRLFQRALVAATGDELVVDGLIGPRTLRSLDECSPAWLTRQLELVWQNKLRALVEADPTQRVFLSGWLGRASGWSDGTKP